MASIDYRIIPLNKRFDKVWKVEVYRIPCKVLEIKNMDNPQIINRALIQRLDFNTGEKVYDVALVPKGTINNLNHNKDFPPFETNCMVRRRGNGEFDLKVYANENMGLVEIIFDVPDIVNNDESLIMEIFEKNYSKLRNWLDFKEEE